MKSPFIIVLSLAAAMVAAQTSKPAATPKPVPNPQTLGAATKPEVKPLPELTLEEKYDLRTAQQAVSSAKLALRDAQDMVDAQKAELDRKVAETLNNHKVSSSDYMLCDGPHPGPCITVMKNDISLKPTK
jgi:hypothetical protein